VAIDRRTNDTFRVPGYNPVFQTVSEIGEAGSPAQIPFTATLCAMALCLLIFAWAFATTSAVGVFSF
jgi:hypothetical protein